MERDTHRTRRDQGATTILRLLSQVSEIVKFHIERESSLSEPIFTLTVKITWIGRYLKKMGASPRITRIFYNRFRVYSYAYESLLRAISIAPLKWSQIDLDKCMIPRQARQKAKLSFLITPSRIKHSISFLSYLFRFMRRDTIERLKKYGLTPSTELAEGFGRFGIAIYPYSVILKIYERLESDIRDIATSEYIRLMNMDGDICMEQIASILADRYRSNTRYMARILENLPRPATFYKEYEFYPKALLKLDPDKLTLGEIARDMKKIRMLLKIALSTIDNMIIENNIEKHIDSEASREFSRCFSEFQELNIYDKAYRVALRAIDVLEDYFDRALEEKV